MDFVAVDVETANPNLASICQIGVVSFHDGAVAQTWQTLVDPEDEFDPCYVSIHGITHGDIHGTPNFTAVLPDLQRLLEGAVVACHTPFDRLALSRAAEKYHLPVLQCSWLDTARVVRRAWPEYAQSGYGLANICEMLHIDFEHHRAEEDARAAGEVLLRTMTKTGLSITDWLTGSQQSLSGANSNGRLAREGDPNGPLAGEVIVFTGTLELSRGEAATVAAAAGCMVNDSVTKRTTLLVVGDQDVRKFDGEVTSSKHRKAEDLITKGQPIRILQESDFLGLVGLE